MKLPMFGRDWRMRWMYVGNGATLHRVYAIDYNDDTCEADGVTACGRMDSMSMPGILGRMGGAPRCRTCCMIVGIPIGNGAPFNEGIDA